MYLYVRLLIINQLDFFFLWSLCPWVNVAWRSEKSHIKASPHPVFIKEEIQLTATSNSLALAHILSILYILIHHNTFPPHTAHLTNIRLKQAMSYLINLSSHVSSYKVWGVGAVPRLWRHACGRLQGRHEVTSSASLWPHCAWLPETPPGPDLRVRVWLL